MRNPLQSIASRSKPPGHARSRLVPLTNNPPNYILHLATGAIKEPFLENTAVGSSQNLSQTFLPIRLRTRAFFCAQVPAFQDGAKPPHIALAVNGPLRRSIRHTLLNYFLSRDLYVALVELAFAHRTHLRLGLPGLQQQLRTFAAFAPIRAWHVRNVQLTLKPD